MGRLPWALVSSLLLGCSAPTPAPTVLPSQPQLPADLLAPAPPPWIRVSLNENGIGFRPLTDDEIGAVRIPVEAAEETALASRGMAFGGDGELLIWKKVGCVLVGWYSAPQKPSHGQNVVRTTHPAYLVQVLANAVPDFPGINVAAVIVDARNGELGTTFGAGPRGGVLGTTCVVSP